MGEAIVSREQAETVCKIGNGAETCRYSGMGPGGFQCFKHRAGFAEMLDERVAAGTIKARGNNCRGILPPEIQALVDSL